MENYYKLPNNEALFVLKNNIQIKGFILTGEGAYIPEYMSFEDILKLSNQSSNKKIVSSTRSETNSKYSENDFIKDFEIISKSELSIASI